ncbi:MAG: hypothetical protein Q7R43_06850 [Candidatus Daviesbacteria bacterium]|nr:hypothetical protein [Candidatus Daviesbacteria bacterium]
MVSHEHDSAGIDLESAILGNESGPVPSFPSFRFMERFNWENILIGASMGVALAYLLVFGEASWLAINHVDPATIQSTFNIGAFETLTKGVIVGTLAGLTVPNFADKVRNLLGIIP